MNLRRFYPAARWQWVSLLFQGGFLCWVCFTGFIVHHVGIRARAALALDQQFYAQELPLRAKADEVDGQIDRLPDDKYVDGTAASREKDRLYGELSPISALRLELATNHLTAVKKIDSGRWKDMQLFMNRWAICIITILFAGQTLGITLHMRQMRRLKAGPVSSVPSTRPV